MRPLSESTTDYCVGHTRNWNMFHSGLTVGLRHNGSMTRSRLAPAWVAAALVVVFTLSGCAHENDRDRVSDPVGAADGAGRASSDSPAPSQRYPEFEASSYTYRLTVMCFCPQVGPVQVTVTDAEVTDVLAEDQEPGDTLPAYVRLSINDIIDVANSQAPDRVEVTWPDGQDHPTRVSSDPIQGATDDEVTYTITDVVLSAG